MKIKWGSLSTHKLLNVRKLKLRTRGYNEIFYACKVSEILLEKTYTEIIFEWNC